MQTAGPEYRKENYLKGKQTSTNFAYECDLCNRDEIRSIAKKVKDEVGWVDVLVTCTGDSSQDIYDTISRTLMSHYWVMKFIIFMQPYIFYTKKTV